VKAAVQDATAIAVAVDIDDDDDNNDAAGRMLCFMLPLSTASDRCGEYRLDA